MTKTLVGRSKAVIKKPFFMWKMTKIANCAYTETKVNKKLKFCKKDYKIRQLYNPHEH